jgi:MFS family permease
VTPPSPDPQPRHRSESTGPVAGAAASDGSAVALRATSGTLIERRAPSGFAHRTFASLRHRDFALLWSGTAVMSAGQWLQQVTLNWLVFEWTGSAFLLGLMNGLRMLPFLFTSLISGVMSDRMDRRKLLLVTQVYLFVTTLLMGVLLLLDAAEVWHLFAFTLISGFGWSFTGPTQQSLTPALVPREDLMNAIALTSAAMNFTRTLGPAIGGFLLIAIGSSGNFLVQAACYGVVIWLIATMRVPEQTGVETSGGSAWRSILDGLSYARSHSLVRTLLLLALVPMTLGLVTYLGLLPIFAEDVYDIGAGGLGVLMAMSGIGSLAAALWVANAGDFRHKGMVLLGTLAVTGIAMIGFGFSPWLSTAIIFLVIAGGAQMVYITITMTVLQTATSDEMRGRVTSIFMLNNGLVPAFSFAAGAVAEVAGAQATVILLGVLITGFALWAMVSLKELRELQ